MDSFLDLQNGFYNALSQGLGFAPGSAFQLFQPSTPVLNETALNNYFNNIPPFSLTQNYIASGGNQFFSDYQGLLSALQGSPNTFTTDVGAACAAGWWAQVQAKKIPMGQWPQSFLAWAPVNGYSSVAEIGSSDLSQMLLDPILSAQNAFSAYGKLPPDWNQSYADLTEALLKGPALSFSMSASTMNSSVTNSWTSGSNDGFFGLWGGSSSTSSESATYASSGVNLSASFANVITFAPAPGNWYSSSAMGLAFANQTGAPWKPASDVNWTNTFDPSTGNMSRFAVSIVVANQMSVTATSVASFNTQQQQNIQQNSGAGMWPFYSSSSNSGTNTKVSFNAQSQLVTNISSAPGVPIVLGCSVLPVGTYVGHSVASAKFFAAALARRQAL